MRKLYPLVLLILVLLPLKGTAGTSTFGIGVQAGLEFPIIQEDQAKGSVLGIKGIWNLMGMISLEPQLTFVKYGEPDFSDYPGIFNGLDGSKVTSYGVNAVLGGSPGMVGFGPYVVAGIGMYKTKRDQTDQDYSRFGMTGGLGFEMGMTANLAVDLRGRLTVIPLEEGGSKKSASVTGGVNYYFGQ